MKTIARTLLILLAAGLIALGWTTYAATDSAQSSLPERPAEFAAADAGESRPPHHDGEEMGFSVGGVLGGLAVLSGQTALVIALVALARLLGNWLSGYVKPAKSLHRSTP